MRALQELILNANKGVRFGRGGGKPQTLADAATDEQGECSCVSSCRLDQFLVKGLLVSK
jgi:hypothetical protein